jgi:hypothetical protein
MVKKKYALKYRCIFLSFLRILLIDEDEGGRKMV